MEKNNKCEILTVKDTFVKKGRIYNITYTSNIPSDAALEAFAKAILKVAK